MGEFSNIRFLHLKGNFSNWTMMGERVSHIPSLVGTTRRDAIVTTRINIPFLVGVPDPNLHLPLLPGGAGRSSLTDEEAVFIAALHLG